MIGRMNNPLRSALLLGMIGLGPSLALADEFRLESVTLPAPLLNDGKVNTVIEASGVEPIGDGHRLLIAHDKDPALYIVETATRPNFGRSHQLAALSQEERCRTEVGRDGTRLRGQFLPDRSAQWQDRPRASDQKCVDSLPAERR